MKISIRKSHAAFAGLAIVVTLIHSPVGATPIGIGAFSGSETVINFDNLTGGSIVGTGDVVTNQYAGLGVTFGNATATANTFLATLIPAASSPNVVFVNQGGGGSFPPLSIFFTGPVTRVGFDFGTSASSFLTIAAYDSANALLETRNFFGASIPLGLGGFAGLEETANIARIDVSSHPSSNPLSTFNYSFDNLRFEGSTALIPEPETYAMLLAGLGLLGYSARRRKQKAA